MGLGELPVRTSMQGYWCMSNANDSSGNGRTLNNVGSVGFTQFAFDKSANFGTSGTKGLTRTTNPFSANRVANLTASFWFGLLDTTSHSGAASRLSVWDTVNLSTSGMRTLIEYTISGGVWTVRWTTFLSVTNASSSFTPSIDTNKHLFTIVKTGTTNTKVYFDGKLMNDITGAGTDVSSNTSSSYRFVIGADIYVNDNTSARGLFDEYILEERSWSDSEIKKYYTQAKGRFCI